ncbi:hypothetical protein PUR71_12870 [Streptomyces sp. SP17BM10]|nr:hypothetical protein [Streptomyces sp. SP17BM10]MEE1783792.1 hypothetical protein [Streptomyces sp. SP17BM10]
MFDEAEAAVELTSGYLRITQPRKPYVGRDAVAEKSAAMPS